MRSSFPPSSGAGQHNHLAEILRCSRLATRALAPSPAHTNREGWEWTSVGARPQRQACEATRLGGDLVLVEQHRAERALDDLGLRDVAVPQLRAELDGVIVQIQPALRRVLPIRRCLTEVLH